MKDYIVPVSFVIKAKDVKEAAKLAKKAFPTGAVRECDIYAEKPDKPAISEALKTLLKDQVEWNDADAKGYNTTLDYCWSNVMEMEEEYVCENAGIPFSKTEANRIKKELKALINQYGGATAVYNLLEDEP